MRTRLGVFTRSPIPEGAECLSMTGSVVREPGRYTLQLDRTRHLDGDPSPARELFHACEPNAFVETRRLRPPDAAPGDRARLPILALRDIAAGEELTIDYCATEWVMSCPFDCRCGSARCYGTVRGYRDLDPRRRAMVARPAPHLLCRS